MNDDQHIMTASMEKALTLPTPLIDSRTERDWLNFIANFASLINFYDHHNLHKGSWEPFILKDPVFLTASISATDHRWLYHQYKNICTHIDKLIAQDDTSAAISEAMNQLLDRLTDIFLLLRKWVHYMQLSPEEYPLKTYTLMQVKEKYSQYLWALLSLRKNITHHPVNTTTAVNYDNEVTLFDAVDGMIWKADHEVLPFWETLGLSYPISQNTYFTIVNAVKKTGDELFNFLQQITGYAAEEMEQLQTRKARFPDTLLLRAFAHILQLQQEQLNLITGKHLDFYYRTILMLKERNATPDHAFICAALLQKNDVLFLPEGTAFDAGIDDKNIPVSFISEEDIILQPSVITKIYTVSVQKFDNRYRLVRSDIEDPGKIKTDANGNLNLWKSFGGGEGAAAAQSFAFASPLLLLREGERCITVTLFMDGADPGSFDDIRFYVSTQQAWLAVNGEMINKIADNNKQLNQATIVIKLDSSQPPVEAFVKNSSLEDPDGLKSEWPLLKIEFLSYAGTNQPVIMSSVKINVTVSGVNNLLLYNDYGPVSAKAPFPLFGPAPLVNSNFIIGNNELFSKPLDNLQLQLNWDKLPADLADYYKEYNAWLNNDLAVLNKPKSTGRKILEWLETLFKNFFAWVLRLFGKKAFNKKTSSCPPFNNTSFTVDLFALEKNQWKNINVSKAKELSVAGNALGYTPYTTDSSCLCRPPKVDNILFSADENNCAITPASCFVLFDKQQQNELFTPDPFIQQTPLVYTGRNDSGFIKMSLSGPEHGFGSAIYASVLNGIALQNAWILYNSQPAEDFFGFPEKKEKPVFIEPAKMPLAPKLISLSANYSATQEYSFAVNVNQPPIQCFYYTPFYNYKVFDQNDSPQLVSPATSFFYNEAIRPGLSVFQPTLYNGILFIEIDHVIPGREISFYFELRQRSQATTNDVIHCCYLSDEGWRELTLLSDTTFNFTCSGILKWIVPADIVGKDKYCFSIASKDNPASKAETAFVSVNGIAVQRLLNPLSQFNGIALPAGSITKSVKPIPSIANLVQPFPSFGGKAQESANDLYIRAANRLATKDRVITRMDIYKLIREQFPAIYSSTTLFDKVNNTIKVYAVGSAEQENGTGEYIPFVNGRVLGMIKEMLAKRTSALYGVVVSNFKFRYLQVVAQVVVRNTQQQTKTITAINDALRSFLAPWIRGDEKKINIGELIIAPGETAFLKTKIAAFIKGIEGVTSVKSIQFNVWDQAYGAQAPGKPGITTGLFNGDNEHILLIPALQHAITIMI